MTNESKPIYIYLDQNHLIGIRKKETCYSDLTKFISNNKDKIKVALSTAHIEETCKMSDPISKEKHIKTVESLHPCGWLKNPLVLFIEEISSAYNKYVKSMGRNQRYSSVNAFTPNYRMPKGDPPLSFGDAVRSFDKALDKNNKLRRDFAEVEHIWVEKMNASNNKKNFQQRKQGRLKLAKIIIEEITRNRIIKLDCGIFLPKNNSTITDFIEHEARNIKVIMASICISDLKVIGKKGFLMKNDLRDLEHATLAVYCDAVLIEKDVRNHLENNEVKNYIKGKAFSDVKMFTDYLKEIINANPNP